MAIHDFNSQRLYLDTGLSKGRSVSLSGQQAHYLANVLRARSGDKLLIFNGRDGEWQAEITHIKKREIELALLEQARPQPTSDNVRIDYLFAPLKRDRLDYLVQKATELGVARMRPIVTDRTIASRVNQDRMRANVIEAAEQCGILRVPEVLEFEKLRTAVADLAAGTPIVFCDEAAPVTNPVTALSKVAAGPVAVVVGPEGGFSDGEQAWLRSLPNVTPISLGPRVMRADTAAVAALALVNAVLGDWK